MGKLVGIVVGFLVVIGIGVVVASVVLKPTSPKYSGPVEKIRVGNVGEYSIFNLIAQEQGFFMENGLDAQITEFTSGPESIGALIKDETDINIGADFVGVRNIFDYPEIRILAQANQHRVFQLAAKKTSGITVPADFKGKRIGVTENSAGEYFLGNFLADNGLRLSDVIMVNLTPSQMLEQLESGMVDAIDVFEPHIYRLSQKVGKENLLTWEIQGNQNVSALVYSKEKYISENPNTVERYIRALVEAENYYKENPEEVKEFVSKKLNYERAYVDYSWPRFTHAITLNQELLLNLENEAAWVIQNGLTAETKVPNYLNFIYLDALEKVKPQAITLTR